MVQVETPSTAAERPSADRESVCGARPLGAVDRLTGGRMRGGGGLTRPADPLCRLPAEVSSGGRTPVPLRG
jgi:hypothetical protein